MRWVGWGVVAAMLLCGPAVAQSPASASSATASRALAALTGGQAVTSVILTGNARWIAGSEDRSGPARIEIEAGAARPSLRVELDLTGGARVETVTAQSDGEPVGQWSDAARGTAGTITLDNLWNDPAWAFPALSRLARAGAGGATAALVGEETRQGRTVEHLRLGWAPAGQAPGITAVIGGLGASDLYLDSATLLPVALDYRLHAKNAAAEIAVEVRYSDYRAVAGVQVPFHVERFLEGGLNLDLALTAAAINAPIAASDFAIAGGAR